MHGFYAYGGEQALQGGYNLPVSLDSFRVLVFDVVEIKLLIIIILLLI